jgi:hypothetical protein
MKPFQGNSLPAFRKELAPIRQDRVTDSLSAGIKKDSKEDA